MKAEVVGKLPHTRRQKSLRLGEPARRARYSTSYASHGADRRGLVAGVPCAKHDGEEAKSQPDERAVCDEYVKYEM